MKATLTFDLPEEREEFDTYLNAFKYYSIMFDFESELRKINKHEEHSEEVSNMIERITDCFYEIKLESLSIE
jgi:hypothetical protein